MSQDEATFLVLATSIATSTGRHLRGATIGESDLDGQARRLTFSGRIQQTGLSRPAKPRPAVGEPAWLPWNEPAAPTAPPSEPPADVASIGEQVAAPAETEALASIVAGGVPQLLAYAREHPGQIEDLAAAEHRRKGGARRTVIAGLRELRDETDPDVARVLEGRNVEEVLGYARRHPERIGEIRDAEEARSQPRKAVLAGLDRIEVA